MTQVVLRMRRDDPGSAPEPAWPDGVTVRALEPDDAPVVHELLPEPRAPFAVWWRDLCLDDEFDPELCFVAVEGEDVVGVAQCWTSAFVKDMAVAPHARRRGIGLALLLNAFRAFAERGASHVDLKVDEENEPARRLYERAGMRVAEMLYEASCGLSDVSDRPSSG